MPAVKIKNGDGSFTYVAGPKGDQGIQGVQGVPGTNGTNGTDGNDGWSPVFAVVTDGARRVLQVVDWQGGEGTKPATGSYVGPTGFTAILANAVDVRGAAGGAPGNMLTTDTAQTLDAAAIKSFPTGTLLMNSAVATGAEPYSDANPPSSLSMTEAAAPSTPANGLATLYTPDGTSLRIKGDGGVDTLIGPAAGGGGSSAVQFDLTQDWTTTQPASPASGVTLFARHRARRTLAVVGPTGLDTALQPAMFSNRVAMLTAVPGSATETVTGFSVARTTAPTAQALAATNLFTRLARLRYSTANGAGTGNGVRSGTGTTGVAGYFLSSTANAGGFFFVARFGVGVSQAGSRGFIGFHTSLTQLPVTADLVGGTAAHVGFGWNAAHTNMYVTSGTGAAGNNVNLGASFPTKTSATDFYEVRLFAPSGSAASVSYSVQRLNTGDFTQGTLSTALPPADTFMVAHVGMGNGTTAAAASIDIQSLYIETDN